MLTSDSGIVFKRWIQHQQGYGQETLRVPYIVYSVNYLLIVSAVVYVSVFKVCCFAAWFGIWIQKKW